MFNIDTVMEQLDQGNMFEVADRSYEYVKIPHEKRLMVFSFYSAHVGAIDRGDFSFFGFDGNFKKIQSIVETCLKCDGVLLNTKKKHWDDHPSDFMPVMMASFIHFSKPFFLESE